VVGGSTRGQRYVEFVQAAKLRIPGNLREEDVTRPRSRLTAGSGNRFS
jgi:hypothetical protein